MLTAKLNELALLRDSITAIAELIDEAELIVRQDGIKLMASDRAVVSVVDFFMAKSAFSEYNYEKDMQVGLNLINFLKILKRANTNDSMALKITEDKFEMKMIGDSTRVFSLPIIDVSRSELPPIDKLEFPAVFEINAEILNNGIEDADLIGDSVVITASSDRVMLRSESETSMTQLELTPDGNSLNILSSSDSVRSRYSLDYLKKMMKARKLAGTVRISLGLDYPLKMIFESTDKSRLGFILAPRVED